MSDEEKVDNLDAGAIETPKEETQTDNSQEETIAPDPIVDLKEKRHAEQLAWSRQEVERTRWLLVEATFDDINNGKKDVSTLLDLYNKDTVWKKVAEEVWAKFDWTDSEWWTFQNFLSGTSKNTVKQMPTEEELDAILDERQRKRDHEKSLEKLAKDIKKLPSEQQEQVQAYIDKFSKGLQLDIETTATLFESAVLFVNKDKSKVDRKQEAIKSMVTWISWWNEAPKSDELILDWFKRKNWKRIPV